MDSEFGPDGSLYLLEYGDGFFRANPDAQLSVIRYVKGTRSPVAVMTATPTSGPAPLTVQFSSAGSHDPDPGESDHVRLGLHRTTAPSTRPSRTRRSPTPPTGSTPPS